MAKTSTELRRHALNGPTMGTRWAAQFYASGEEVGAITAALQAAVTEVDAQMTTWSTASDLMRLNRAPTGAWTALPERLITVLGAGVEIGRLSGGAFDIGMGEAVTAWGFGAETADPERIRAALSAPRTPAHEALELDIEAGRARKHAPLALDLSGIAKGYGVDRLSETLADFGITEALTSIDGELRAGGTQPGGAPWAVAVEKPDRERRAAHSVLALEDAAVATSGDYRHWVDVGGARLSHTMDPRRGAPVQGAPASVTVVAKSCMEADAFATALMVMGQDEGRALAEEHGLSALFLMREGEGLCDVGVGPVFAAG